MFGNIFSKQFSSILNYSFLILISMSSAGLFSGAIYAAEKSAQSSQQITTLTVNINKASAEEISDVMTGVGLKKAVAIVEYRKKMGAFKIVDDLLGVKGIGPATLKKNRHKLKL